MTNSSDERDTKGPDSYEYFNQLSGICQTRYLFIIKIQLFCFAIIAILSIIPLSWNSLFEKIIEIFSAILIIIVLISMIIQHRADYMDGWQKCRYLAESILSNSWLIAFKYEKYKTNYNSALSVFHKNLKNLKNEINVNNFLHLLKQANNDNDNPNWIKETFKSPLKNKKDFYIEYRIDNQIEWYSRKAEKNKSYSDNFFKIGLLLMATGIFLTLLSIFDVFPSLSYLGLFTTLAVSIFSWIQTKRYEELKTTYGVVADELSDIKKVLLLASKEAEVLDIVSKAEKAISREHKLWFSGRL